MNVDGRADNERALAALRTAASGRAPEAAFRLGVSLVQRHQNEEALAWHLKAADAGHVAAQAECGRMLLLGLGCSSQSAQAVEWLLRAESGGDAVAAYWLAMLGLGGVVLPRDGMINQRVLAAVKADHPPAIRAAAIHFGRRRNDEDQSLCLQLLGRGSNLGDVVAAQLLVERLARGEGCDAQPEAAADLAAQLLSRGTAALPAITAAVPALILPLRRAGLAEPGTLALEDALQLPAIQVLAEHPRVMQIDTLLSADECRLLAAVAQPALRHARTIEPRGGQMALPPTDTGSAMRVVPLDEDLALRVVQLRMARAARTELVHAEALCVQHYAAGETCRLQGDALAAARLAADHGEAGNRARTIRVYLNRVEAGGEAEFPQANLRVRPVPGRALMFDNLHADGRVNYTAMHATRPVTHGESWQATLWLRERRYRTF